MTFSTIMHFSRPTFDEGKTGGFTLVELLIVVAIAAILAAVTVPSFRTMSRNMAVRGAADELIAGIQFARSEAIRTNRPITLALSDRTWQVFIDTNKNRTRSSDEELLREGTYSSLISGQNSPWWFEFSPSGMISSSKTFFPTTLCLKIDGTPPIQRGILFQSRATSPVVHADCPIILAHLAPISDKTWA